MVTMSKIMRGDESKELTLEYIQGKLFSFYDIAQKFHHDTKSFAEHKALGGFYEKLGGFRDEIPEKLMGYNKGKRIGGINIDPIPSYSHEAAVKLVGDVMVFAKDLEEWSEKKEYCDIENIAQSLSGEAALTAYLLTLS